MAVRRIPAGAGLVTDPSALVNGPRGGMRLCKNVSPHRAQALQPRPGFGDQTGIAARSTSYRPVELVEYRSQSLIVVQSHENGADDWRLEGLGVTTVYSSATAEAKPPDVTKRGRSSFIESRGNLYHTSSVGIRKLSLGGSTVHERAGLWQTYQPPASVSYIDPGSSSDRVAIDTSAADNAVAYRWVVRRVDQHDYEVRSAPSARLLATATNVSYPNGLYVEIGKIFLPADAKAGDELELYRTPNSGSGTVDPGEDFYLVATYELTSTDISNGFSPAITWTDDVSDAALGVTLYTSSSQLGILASKEIPPQAQHLAYWNGCAWAGNLIERSTQKLTLTKVAYRSGGTHRLEGEGLCFLENITGDFTSGSPVIANVSFSAGMDWDALANGMWLSETLPNVGSTHIPAGAKILSFSSGANTITMDVNASAGAPTNASFKAGDIVEVDGSDFYAFDQTGGAVGLRYFDIDQNNTDHAARRANAAEALAESICQEGAGGNINVYAIKDDILAGGDGSLLLISNLPESGTFTVTVATRPSAFAEDVAAQITSRAQVHPDRIQWSALDEPEAWPVVNFVSVGDQDYEVLALVPLDDALLVFKEDGIYRVSGSPPSGWIVDELDTTKRLLAPTAVCLLDGVCFAWTDRGVVPVTEGGVGEPISIPIDDQLREVQRTFPRGDTGAKRGIWLQSHARLGLVIVNASSASSGDEADLGQWVWSKRTGAWATWDRVDDRCSVYDSAEDRMLLALGDDGWDCFYERLDEDNGSAYEDRKTGVVTPNSWQTSTLVYLTKTDIDWTPTLCDVLQVLSEPNTYSRITNVEDGGTTWNITFTPAAQTGNSIILHEGYECELSWQAQHLPGTSARWQELHVALLSGESEYLSSWLMEVGAQVERDVAASTVVQTISADVEISSLIRSGLPRAVVRGGHLYAYIKICAAGVLWRIGELALHHQGTSRRVKL